MENKYRSEQGTTLIELLVVSIIGVIVLMALTLPFVAGTSFRKSGERQTEAQRDAQLILTTMAHASLDSTGNPSYSLSGPSGARKITFTRNCGASTYQVYFEGGPAYNGGSGPLGQFHWHDNGCGNPAKDITLINGVRSRVTNFTLTSISNKLVKINLSVTHTTQGNQEVETLETQLFLRNAT